MTSSTPPPYLRDDIRPAERRQIERLLGPLADERLVRAVRDGRGREFQRLEFLGDSVLDVVLSVHRWVEPACDACQRTQHHTEATDRHLAEAARVAGVGEWLEWRASDERVADLVETCIAACWLNGSWAQAATFVDQVVHPVNGPTVTALTVGFGGEPGRVGRRVGSALLELSAAFAAYRARPEADEGALSQARAQVHQAKAIAHRAVEIGEVGDVRFFGRDVEVVLSQVEDALAATVASAGVDAALALAGRFVSVPEH